MSTPVLYYNKAHFQKAGLDPDDPPETLDEVEAAAKKLKAAGVSKTPFAINLDRWYFEVWVNGAGGDLVNNGNGRDAPATASVFDNEQAKRLFAGLQRMQSEGLLQPFSNTPGQINQYLALAQQQASMTLGTSAAANTIKAFLKGTLTSAEAGGIDTSAEILATAQIVPAAAAFPGLDEPGKVRVSGGAFFLLNKSKPEVQAASWEFAKFMLQPENAAYWNLHGGYLPMVKAAAQLPEVQAYWHDDLAGQMSKVAYDQLGAVDVFQPGPPDRALHGVVRRRREDVGLDAAGEHASGQGTGQRREVHHRGAEGLQRLTSSDPARPVPDRPCRLRVDHA